MSALITLDYAKTVLRIAGPDYDPLLTALIAGVSRAIQSYCGRDLVSTNYVELYDGSGASTLTLRRFPILALNSVTLDANSSAPTTCTSASFILRPTIGQIILAPQPAGNAPALGPIFPRGRGNLQVDYTAGLEPIPDDLQMAAALAVANLYNQPDLTKQREKIGASYYYIGRPGELAFTPEVKAILNLYRDPLL